MRFLTCSEDTEISGDVLLSLLNNMNASEIAPYLKQYNLDDVRRGKWYKVRDFHNLLNELAKHENQVPNFVAIGIVVGETGLMPPELGQPTLEKILEHWNDHYQLNHRGGDIGYKTTEKLGDKHYRLTLHGGLYPDDLEYGVLYGFAKQLLPLGVYFTVWYDEDVQRLDHGGEETVLHIKWE